ncbi:asparagine synthase (glutamine-hydrolyzing) [Polaromonas sp. CG_9.5]|uniref:asparagine synthase (glutamine-hydrolyzing) n=1 Tax=Polaromonas sp. CG_9.5 TaxID=3071705 RepID=UPI002E1477C2
MCGFAGFLLVQAGGLDSPEVLATHMANAIAHRGPDDFGAWADAQAGVALGHRRLSIVDLSPAGHQPMASRSGRFVMAFNGEIYNHMELRAELEKNSLFMAGGIPQPSPSPSREEGVGRVWRGHSDTETLLAGFEQWGIEATLAKTVGMFAIAVWDLRERTLHLTRDRFGEKPLYYGWAGSGAGRAFVFGSELKALRAFPEFVNPVCRQALAQYMRFMYVPAPRSIYQGIYKLEPGCVLTITGAPPAEAPAQPLRPPAVHGSLSVRRWWSLADVVQAGAKNQLTDEVEAVQQLEQRLADAVRLQSLADVPLGAFLSGGVDSSAIVALMQQQATRPVKTFTVGFEEAGFDESPYARAVAKHLGTDHAELFVKAAEAQAVIAQLPAMYDEPFADSSQIPTHLVCRAARQHVTVALSGDAGDELFGGYNRYFWGPRIWAKLAWLPYPVRQALGAAISAMPIAGWDALSRPANALLPGDKGIAQAGDKAHKLAARLRGVRDLDDLYMSLVSEWQDPAHVVRGDDSATVSEPASLLNDPLPASGVKESPLRMMYRDSMTYLPDDILCKVDRAAMATSLETRVPFLDHRVAELAWQMPLGMKIRGSQGKWALRQVLYKHVPRELIDRPKAGFGIPVGQWLCGPLRPWAEGLLAEKRLQQEGYFYPAPIRQKWAEHLAGQRDHTASLWAVLMFQSWLESVS